MLAGKLERVQAVYGMDGRKPLVFENILDQPQIEWMVLNNQNHLPIDAIVFDLRCNDAVHAAAPKILA
jgi:hypothetical protein